ncbi:MAG: hypothetical protein IPN31_16420 [Bacteroidetes bacterium]|nr:hypothetical protein [Bacteroidota bacterium]
MKHIKSCFSMGLELINRFYDTLDSLEKKVDLERLVEVLIRNKSNRGEVPIFTCNMVMGNPNYEAIENNNFEKFFHRNLFDSYTYYYNEDLRHIWDYAIEKKILKPQFHAREHLNISLWMKDLKNNLHDTRFAFNNGFYGLKTITSSRFQNNYLAAYYAESFDQLENIKITLEDGIKMFQDFWKMKPRSFVCCQLYFT